MKIASIVTISLLAVSLLSAAETNTNDQVKAAIKKLNEQPNYSWTTKIEMPGMPFTPEPQHGKVAKDGIAMVTQDFNGNNMQVVFKDGKIAVFSESQWEAVNSKDAADFGNFPVMIARMLAGSGTAAKEAETLLGNVRELKAGEDGLWSGDLAEKGVAGLLAFGPSREGGGAAVKNGKGSAKFWIKDGGLVKFQAHASGLAPFGPDQEERDMEVTRTVEIQDVGTTKVEIPEAAKKKLEEK